MTDPTPRDHDALAAPADSPMSGPGFAPGVDLDSVAPPTRSPSLRQSVREDLRKGRAWADGRVQATREHIREAPTRALAYGLGAGLIVGLMLRR
ncbi:MAG TPA: hypothetical protein VGN74_06915 [Brevundimonas sp.]|jgi:hypothetical protein|uniref:hypothetical protein n=1 Tax=Brevundimonas sp. TaxID=1871086 RepID=UPI002E152919|nr:hypothetical protein [Brevundimonas sp.]